jgi:hypothetical protein
MTPIEETNIAQSNLTNKRKLQEIHRHAKKAQLQKPANIIASSALKRGDTKTWAKSRLKNLICGSKQITY